MRRAANIDSNQPQVVEALRGVGATVQHLHAVGRGCPDLLVGYRGRNHLLELKDGAAVPSKQRLTDDEERWHSTWRGRVVTVRTVDEALSAIGAVQGGSTCEDSPRRSSSG
jgi:hypothetical protein